MRFKVGQEVVCTKEGVWRTTNDLIVVTGPKFNEIVTVSGNKDNGYLYLKEYPRHEMSNNAAWSPRWFEPIISTEELEKELSGIAERELIVIQLRIKLHN